MNRSHRLALPVSALALLVAGVSAQAASVNFNVKNITGNSAINAAAGESQLSVTVDDNTAGFACFTFNNLGPAPMSITSIYWENGLASLNSSNLMIDAGPGVAYTTNTGNLNLPGGNQPLVNFDEAFGVEPTKGKGGFVNHGVGLSEFLKVCIALTGDFNDVISALNTSDRVGFHVQAFGDGGSEAFVTTPGHNPPTTAVPTPSAVGLGFAMLLGLAARRRRRDEDPA